MLSWVVKFTTQLVIKNAIVMTKDSLTSLISNLKSPGGPHKSRRNVPENSKLELMLKLKLQECRQLMIHPLYRLSLLQLRLEFNLLNKPTFKLRNQPKLKLQKELLPTRLLLKQLLLLKQRERKNFLLRDKREKQSIRLLWLLLQLQLRLLLSQLPLLKEESYLKKPKRQRNRQSKLRLLPLLLLNKKRLKLSWLNRRLNMKLIKKLKKLLRKR